MSGRSNGKARRFDGMAVRQHLQALRVGDLKEVAVFWSGDDVVKGTKAQIIERLEPMLTQEGTVYRRVRTLTRRVLDVLLLLLRREGFASDLPGLFQRLPGEDAITLEYHEVEAGLKALARRGFVAAKGEKGNGRLLYAVPLELGELMTALFREETRTVGSVFSLQQHAEALTASERNAWREQFPELGETPGPGDIDVVVHEGPQALMDALPDEVREVIDYAIARHGGVMRRKDWSRRRRLRHTHWDRAAWAPVLERHGVGTVAHLNLKEFGIACDDDVLVVFDEVLERLHRAEDLVPEHEVLRAGSDLAADLGVFIESVRRNPVRISRNDEVYKADRRRIRESFVFRESELVDRDRIFDEVLFAAQHLGLVQKSDDGFLELRPGCDAYLQRPLEEIMKATYRLALERSGSVGRSLHQSEMRRLLADKLCDDPERWWVGRSLAADCRHRYLATLEARGIRDRYRDRFFSAYFSGRETPADLLIELDRDWMRQLFVLGLLDAAVDDQQRVIAWRLSALGARVLGAEGVALDTGLRPLLVNPDFEVLVLPEGDVSDVVHRLDLFAQREKTDDVVHFRLTRDRVESAVGAGRSMPDFIEFLEARSRGGVPQNVIYSLESWAGSVTFATWEKGVVLRAESEEALDRILVVSAMESLLVRRLGEGQALLRKAPEDRKLVASLRERGIELQGQ